MRTLAQPLDASSSSPSIENGIYIDSTLAFSLPIPVDWWVEEGNPYGERRLRVRHSIEPYAIEIWRLPEILYQPVPREDCLWVFKDRGNYREWSANRMTNVATCYPIDPKGNVIFAHLKHWQGVTWQLESHVSMDVIVEGERATRDLLHQINWLDGATSQTTERP